MRRLNLKRLCWGWALLALSLSAAASAGVARDRLEAFNRTVQSLSADFEQILFDEDGNAVKRSTGRVAIQRPGRFRWDYEKPYPQLILADGSRLWIYDPDLDQVTVKPLAEALGNAPAMLLSGEQDLEADFIIQELPARDGLQWVELYPRKADSEFRLVRLGFGKRLEMMEFEDPLGQKTRIRFRDMQINARLDPGFFRFTPPPGADVVGQP